MTRSLLAPLAVALALTGATAHAQTGWGEPTGPLDVWQEGPWPGMPEMGLEDPADPWVVQNVPRTEPSVGAPLDPMGILDTPGTAAGTTLGVAAPATTAPSAVSPFAEDEATPILPDAPITVTELPETPGTEEAPATTGTATQDTAPATPATAAEGLPLPRPRDEAAFDAARIDKVLRGLTTEPQAPLATDCEAWAKVGAATEASASVLVEIACLAGQTVIVQLGDNTPETLVLDSYGAAQVVLGASGALHPMTVRRASDGALLARQDDADLPPTVYAP